MNFHEQPPISRRIDLMDQYFAAAFRKKAIEKERTLRELAAPFLRAGYMPHELEAVERAEQWVGQHYVYVCVKIARERSQLRLWWRRQLIAFGLLPAPEEFLEGPLWRA